MFTRLVLLSAVVASGAWAQCTKDTECPGDGICMNGSCAAASADVPVAQPTLDDGPSLGSQANKPRHWATGAAVLGFSMSAPVVASGVMTMFFMLFSASAVMPYGIFFAVLTATLVGVVTPVVALGGGSARYDPANKGLLVGRIFGWSLYGLSLASTVAAVSIFASEELYGIPPLLMLGALITGAVALIVFAVDAVVSGATANSLIKPAAQTKAVLRFQPTVALAPRSNGTFDPLLGLVGTF